MNNPSAPATQINLDAFCDQLAKEYEELFKTPEYALAAARFTPAQMARKMTLGLDNSTASKDGEGVKLVCKHFGIAHTYKAIRAFLSAQ